MHLLFPIDCANVCGWILQAVERLNLKPRHFRDLLTDESFTRGDIIVLQDPMSPERFDVSSFYHVKNKLAVKEGELVSEVSVFALYCVNVFATDDSSGDASKSTRFIRQLNPETRATLEALSKEYKEPTPTVC